MMISRAEIDEAVSKWIAKGWTVKVLKPRPPHGKHRKNYNETGGK
jgi:hypothetical protein